MKWACLLGFAFGLAFGATSCGTKDAASQQFQRRSDEAPLLPSPPLPAANNVTADVHNVYNSVVAENDRADRTNAQPAPDEPAADPIAPHPAPVPVTRPGQPSPELAPINPPEPRPGEFANPSSPAPHPAPVPVTRPGQPPPELPRPSPPQPRDGELATPGSLAPHPPPVPYQRSPNVTGR